MKQKNKPFSWDSESELFSKYYTLNAELEMSMG